MDDYTTRTGGSGRIVRHNSVRAEQHGSPTKEMLSSRSPTKELHVSRSPTKELHGSKSPNKEMHTIGEAHAPRSPTREMHAVTKSPTKEMHGPRSPTMEMQAMRSPTWTSYRRGSPSREIFTTLIPTKSRSPSRRPKKPPDLNKMDRIEPRTSRRLGRAEHRVSRKDERSSKDLLDDIKNLKRQTNAEIHALRLQLKTSDQKYTQLLKRCNLQIRDMDKSRAENTKLSEKIRYLTEQCRDLRQTKSAMTKQLERQARQTRSMSLDRGTPGRQLSKRYSRSSTAIDRKGLHQRCISRDDFSNLLHKCDKLVDDYDTLKSQLSSHDNVLHQIHRTVSQDNIRLERNYEESEAGMSPNFDHEVRKLEMVLHDKNNEIKALKSHLEEQMQISDEQWKLMQMKEDEMEKEKSKWKSKISEAESDRVQLEDALKREQESHQAELKESETAAKKNNDILRSRLDEMIDELRRISQQQNLDEHTIAVLKEENARLKESAQQMRLQLNYSSNISSPPLFRSPIPQKRWIIPLALYDDDVLLSALDQLLLRLELSVYLQPMKSKEITAQYDGKVVVPVLGEAVVATGIQHALAKSKLGNVSANILVFHHLAPHSCRIYTPTRSRVSVRDIVGRYNVIVDVVFWNGSVYECETNANAVRELNDIVKRF